MIKEVQRKRATALNQTHCQDTNLALTGAHPNLPLVDNADTAAASVSILVECAAFPYMILQATGSRAILVMRMAYSDGRGQQRRSSVLLFSNQGAR